MLMPSDKDDGDEITKILMYSDEYAETNQNEKNIIIKKLNDNFDKMIEKSKSLQDQIKSLEKVENPDEYYFINDSDDKELKSIIFKLKIAYLLKIIDKKLFEQIFGHTLDALANKLINITNKEENQIIVTNIDKNRDKLYEMDLFNNDWMIQPSDRCIDLIDAIDLISDFNENENENVNENENGNVNKNDETLMSSDKDDDDETMSQKKKKKEKNNKKIK